MRQVLSIATVFFLLSAYAMAATLPDSPPPQPGQLLVKLKPAFAYLNADGQSMRTAAWKGIAPSLSIGSTLAFSTFQSARPSANARRNTPSEIDLRLYHQLSFDPSIPLDQAIEELMKSGMVEVAEPVHTAIPYQLPDDPLLISQHYLEQINAYKGWEITKGSSEIIIAIVDSGVDMTHPDLLDNLYYNEADPIDELDNDGDGFVDNYWGWDFAGDDFAAVSAGDNNPHGGANNTSHGTKVAGCASAVADNGIGIAGLGYQAKLMVLKHTADNDTRYNGIGFLTNILQGVLYAASQGAHIINASYGSTYYSQIANDVYRHVALEYGVLVVAAAGNSNYPGPHYPSDYDYVLSVAAATPQDTKASFSNFSYGVALTAPGEGIASTQLGGNYGSVSGTSFAAPLVSGAAALVKSLYPDFTGRQLGEVLRVSADAAFTTHLEEVHENKMGSGRLDVYAALTHKGPSIRADALTVEGPQGDIPKAGQQAYISAEFINLLWSASGASVRLSVLNDLVSVATPVLELGNMATMQSISPADGGFVIDIHPDLPYNTEVLLRLDFSADGYEDQQYITLLLNPSFYTLHENQLATTISGTGRVGYEDAAKSRGIGFEYQGGNMLYEMGLMMGTSTERVVSSVRASSGIHDDFAELTRFVKQDPGPIADVEISGLFSDARAYHTRKLGVEVAYRTMVWREEPYDKTILFEYTIHNRNAAPLEDFFVGYFADWDINPVGYRDIAEWDAATQTAYVYAAPKEERKVAGIQVLGASPHYWAMDNTSHLEEGNIGVYDGYSEEEKYRSISSGIGRSTAGDPEEGSDVSIAIGAGPYTIAAGDSITVVFALHGGMSIEEVLTAAEHARLLYERTAGLRKPTGILVDALGGLQLYPNPSRGEVTLSWPQQQRLPYAIRVFDMAGRQVMLSQSAQDYAGEAVRLQLPPQKGLYVLEISQGQKRAIRRVAVQ